jgi:hypothetical protein
MMCLTQTFYHFNIIIPLPNVYSHASNFSPVSAINYRQYYQLHNARNVARGRKTDTENLQFKNDHSNTKEQSILWGLGLNKFIKGIWKIVT